MTKRKKVHTASRKVPEYTSPLKSKMPLKKLSRCPNGSRKNKRTGLCEQSVHRRAVSHSTKIALAHKSKTPVSKIKLEKRSRCPNGSRKNKRTGLCDPILKERAFDVYPLVGSPAHRVWINPMSPTTRYPLYHAAYSPRYDPLTNISPGSPRNLSGRENPLYHAAYSPRYGPLTSISPGSPRVLSARGNPLYHKESSPQYGPLTSISPGSPRVLSARGNPLYHNVNNPQYEILTGINSPSPRPNYFSDTLLNSPNAPRSATISKKSPFEEFHTPSSELPSPIYGNPPPFDIKAYQSGSPQYHVPYKMLHRRSVKKSPPGPPIPPKMPREINEALMRHRLMSQTQNFPFSEYPLSKSASPRPRMTLSHVGLKRKKKRHNLNKSAPSKPLSSYSLPLIAKDKYSLERKNPRSMSRFHRNLLPRSADVTLKKRASRQQTHLARVTKSPSPAAPSPKRVSPSSPFYEMYPAYSPLKYKSRKSMDLYTRGQLIANKNQMKEFTKKLKYEKELADVRRIVANSTRKKTPETWGSYAKSFIPSYFTKKR